MDDSTALTTAIDELLANLGLGDDHLRVPIHSLAASGRLAVGSYVGFELVMVLDGHPVALSQFEPGLDQGHISTSLRLPLTVLSAADPASTITLYATTPGAFLDLAADLTYALGLADPDSPARVDAHDLEGDIRRISLDLHVAPVSLVSGVVGLAELSVINQAVGILLGRGHSPEDATVELRRQAEERELSIHALARELVTQSSGDGATTPAPQAGP